MPANILTFTAKIWLYPGNAAWHFVTVPVDLVPEINMFADKKRGWGSLKVRATVGQSTWDTSIFPEKSSQSYVLPLKKSIRESEKLKLDDDIKVKIEII